MARIPVAKLVRPLLNQAVTMMRDPRQLEQMLAAVKARFVKPDATLVSIKTEILTLVRFVQKTLSRDYQLASKGAVTLAVVGFIYLLSPIDLIPDLLPTGLVDDFAVLAYVLRTIKIELDRFKTWERKPVSLPPQDEELADGFVDRQENSAPSE